MIVPKYWAEAKSKTIVNERQITLKRFGWSDTSESDAENNAQKRVKEAISLAESGIKVRKIDHKVSYNGAEGLPIREEIICTYNDMVITRNSYGAMCINTPDVLFADIDFQNEPGFKFYFIIFLILACIAALLSRYFFSWGIFFFLLFSVAIVTTIVSDGAFKLLMALKGGSEKQAKDDVVKFSKNNPDWHLRLYRTPNGYRILVLHKTFNPKDEEALLFLKAIHSDPIYVQMCKNQNCFRARVSPKPWRIGVDRMGPRPGVWPIKEERIPDRIKWVTNYEKVALNYASCKFVEKLGSDLIDPKAEYVRSIHDKFCRSDNNLKIA